MIALLSAMFGFLSSGLPHLLEYFKTKQSNAHELQMLERQLEIAKVEREGKIEASYIESSSRIDVQEIKRMMDAQRPTGIRFIDALNGSVRPVITYAFFGLYTAVKIAQYKSGLPWLLWTEEDQAIFAGIISFYFGQRTFKRVGK